MLSDDYLIRGFAGLSRAVDHNWTQGHFGCAVIATWLLSRTDLLDESAEDAMRVELDAMMESRAHLFGPVELTAARPELVDDLPRALAPHVADLLHGGHNAIYAGLALEALAARPELATAELIGGVVRLLEVVGKLPVATDFHGVDVTQLVAADDASTDYEDEADLAESAFTEALAFEEMHYELQGHVGHLLTHAHALISLSRLGWPELSRHGHVAHRAHVRQVRLLHSRFDKSLWTPVAPRGDDPLAPSFWEADREAMAESAWGYAHFFKYRYQFYDLLRYVQDNALRERCLRHMPMLTMNEFAAQGRSPAEYMAPLPA